MIATTIFGMSAPGFTKLFIIAAVALIIAYDIFIDKYAGEDATISVVLGRWAYAEPVLPFAIGMLMGHLFWRWTHPGVPLRPPINP